MREPLKRISRQQKSVFKSFPAPVGGWNARDSFAEMRLTDAIALDNFFPKTGYVEIRGGYSTHATSMTGNGKTLAVHNGQDGTNTMFGATSSGVYDVTSFGAVGAAAAAVTDGKFQWVNYGDGGVNYLLMFNGVDNGLYFDGSSWTVVTSGSSPALVGLATSSIIHVNVFKERLFFIEKASQSFWYLPAGSVGGTLTEYPMDSFFKKGGYLMAMGTWSLDSGSGIDDRAVFMTSEGEVAVFEGNNPASTTFWNLVGIYQLPKPLGRRCFTKLGGDLAVITESGVFPLSVALKTEDERAAFALSFKIQDAFNKAGRTYGTIFGWEATFYPAQSALVVNIPISLDGTHYQYVMNTVTKAWCRFTNWNAEAFVVFNGELYFTTSNKVVKAWTGKMDGTDNIEVYGKQAFSDFGDSGVKQFVGWQPVLAVNGPLSFLTDIDVDFNDNPITGSATYNVTSGALWDVDNWDEGYWGAELETVKEWTSPSEYMGRWASPKVKIATNYLDVQWMASNLMFIRGAGL